jgi:hypothetical protein
VILSTIEDALEEPERPRSIPARNEPVKNNPRNVVICVLDPATSLCLAENAGLVKIDHGGDPPSSQASPCCVLASALYKLDDNGSAVVPGLGNKISLFRDTFDARPRLGTSLGAGSAARIPLPGATSFRATVSKFSAFIIVVFSLR